MTLAEILASLFPAGHEIVQQGGILLGSGPLKSGGRISVIGVADRTPLGVDDALRLAGHVLAAIEAGGSDPILVLIDSDSQRMSKRDELLGLNEFLAHLGKCLILASVQGHHTVGLLYGHSAAGAFIATAMSTQSLVALPGATPAVMDLPSISKVTKLSIEALQEKARSTPVFAPGLANLAQTGAVLATWDDKRSLADQLAALLAAPATLDDQRDRLGKDRKGRPKAADIAARVHDLARPST
ncbi:biotin-independent malonate decarboxylase subunit gamma [Reyranella sp.]|uniref:biotin-independent malonate decarboxylase subunit gamma n=1 Tax=Reyranella sp. TaxID=1929291 RepID=UPI0037851620